MGPHKSPASSTSSFAQLSPDLSPGQLPPLPNVTEVVKTRDVGFFYDCRIFSVSNRKRIRRIWTHTIYLTTI